MEECYRRAAGGSFQPATAGTNALNRIELFSSSSSGARHVSAQSPPAEQSEPQVSVGLFSFCCARIARSPYSAAIAPLNKSGNWVIGVLSFCTQYHTLMIIALQRQ